MQSHCSGVATTRRARRHGAALRLMVVVTLLVPCTATALAQGDEQILRQQGEGAGEILTTDRVARLVLALPVPPETAFEAWTDANQMVEWLCHWAEMTVAAGEGFRIGWDGFDAAWEGRYVEVARPERLVFSWLPPVDVFPAGAYETLVTLTFDENDDGTTLMTLEHSGFTGTPELELQMQAWRSYLFALRAFLLQPRTDG